MCLEKSIHKVFFGRNVCSGPKTKKDYYQQKPGIVMVWGCVSAFNEKYIDVQVYVKDKGAGTGLFCSYDLDLYLIANVQGMHQKAPYYCTA